MSFSSVGDRGLTASTTAATSLAHTIANANVPVGAILVVDVVINNRSATEGNTNDITSVTDSGGNTYTKLYEWTNANGAQNNGTTVAQFISKITTALTAGSSTVTGHFGSSSANIVAAWEYSVASGSTVSKVTQATGDADNTTTGPILSVSGLTSKEYLFLVSESLEGKPTDTYTKDTDYTLANSGGTGGSIDDAQQTLRASYRIVTATGDTYAATNSANQDWASIMVVLQENTTGPQTVTHVAPNFSMNAGTHTAGIPRTVTHAAPNFSMNAGAHVTSLIRRVTHVAPNFAISAGSHTTNTKVFVSQELVEAVVADTTPTLVVSQELTEVVVVDTTPAIQVSQAIVEAVVERDYVYLDGVLILDSDSIQDYPVDTVAQQELVGNNNLAKSSATPGTTFTFTSVSPVANTLMLVFILAANTTAQIPTSVTHSGVQGDFELEVGSLWNTNAAPLRSLSCWSAVVGSSPSSGSVVVTFPSSHLTCEIIVVFVPDYDPLDSFGLADVSTSDSSTTSNSTDMSSIEEGSKIYSAIGFNNTGHVNEDASSGRLLNYISEVSSMTLAVFDSTEDLTPGIAWNTASLSGMVSIEVRRKKVPVPANVAPTADLVVSPTSGSAPLRVNFDASGSTDSDGTIVSYRFTAGDGADSGPQTSPKWSHVYSKAGIETWVLVQSAAQFTGLAAILAHTGITGVSFAQQWDQVETSLGVYDFTDMLACLAIAQTAGVRFAYRVRGGDNTPTFRRGRTWVPTSGQAAGAVLPCPFKTDGTPNTTFINGFDALFSAVDAEFTSNSVDGPIHCTWFGGLSAELFALSSSGLGSLAGWSEQNVLDAHVALITKAHAYAATTEFPISGFASNFVRQGIIAALDGSHDLTQQNSIADGAWHTWQYGAEPPHGFQMIHDGDYNWDEVYANVVYGDGEYIEVYKNSFTGANSAQLYSNVAAYSTISSDVDTYHPRVTVTDDDGAVDTADGTVTVSGTPPTVAALVTGCLSRPSYNASIGPDGYNPEISWATLEPTEGTLVTTALDNAIASGHPFRLRLEAGLNVPSWVKTATGTASVINPQSGIAGTVAKWWTATYLTKWTNFVNALAALYDETTVKFVFSAACQTVYAEPCIRGFADKTTTDNLRAAGLTEANDIAAQKATTEALANAFTYAHIGMAFNPYQAIQTTGWATKESLTEELMDYFRGLYGKRFVLQNNSIRDYSQGPAYDQMYDHIRALGKPFSFQTSTWSRITNDATTKHDALINVLDKCVAWGAHAVEMPNGHDLTSGQLTTYGGLLDGNA